MKIGIVSDCHLGINKFRKMINSQNAYSYINNLAFIEALNILKDKTDCIIIPGDLFEYPNPQVFHIKLVQEQFRKFNKKIYILGGNHEFLQLNYNENCHPFDLIINDNVYGFYKKEEIININDQVEITFIPYKCLNENTYKNIYKGNLKNKNKISILVIHGYVDLNNDNDSEEFALPKEVAINYHLVICGHIHLNSLIKTKSTSILIPGSIMPSNQSNEYNSKPSVWVYDTDINNIEQIELKSPPEVKNIITSNINEILNYIINDEANNIYLIKYNGSVKDIDECLYKKALLNALNISIQTNENLKDIQNIKEINNFWDFIQNNYPEYYDEFKTIIQETNNE